MQKKSYFSNQTKIAVFLLWTFLAFFYVFQQYYITLIKDKEFELSTIIIWELSYFYTWAVLTLIIIFLARKNPLEKQNLIKNGLLHFIFALVIAFVHRAGSMFIYLVLAKPEDLEKGLPDFFGPKVILGSFDGFIIYWMILGVFFSFEYYQQVREQKVKSARLESQLAKAELTALKMQLNPHFLFNTLHAISSLIDSKGKDAQNMLVRLSDFLRQTLESEGQQNVSIKKEISFLKSYLEIEQIRFGKRLSVEYNIEESLSQKLIPTLILQPLVENAIKHGISPHSGQGKIEISVSEKNSFMEISVCDNGKGIGQDIVEHVGLKNTRQRLEQVYGKSSRLKYYNRDQGGFCVHLSIPLEKEV
ncbi:MAG: hypothetical protein D8M58_19200 [Calditrichaeota bacterium]|nr:MAG: hypothetical protein DWQ03_21880 [Calditrichota bacterium]MBL1207539.1 hypothetical protein [Calditrichota bacterium]NOG47371.1 histidine kinase [Calditrichota bacterium]